MGRFYGALLTLALATSIAGGAPRARASVKSGALVVQTERDGGRVQAEIRILDRTKAELAVGQSGNKLEVPAGRLRVEVRYTPEAGLPVELFEDLVVAAGSTRRLLLDLSDGTLRLLVLHNGRPARGLVSLFRVGSTDRLLEFESGREALVPPGIYDVVVALENAYDFEGQRLRRVKVEPGHKTQRKVMFTMGTLRVDARLYGQQVPARAYLFLPGAPDYFNFVTSGQDAVLSPGRYSLHVVLNEEVGYDAARPPDLGLHSRTVVQARRRTTAKVDFTPGTLVVQALKNGKTTEAALAIQVVGTGIDLTRGPAGEPIALAAGRYDVEVRFPNGRGGEVVRIENIEVPTGRLVRRRAAIERGNITIDTYAEGQRVDAEVRYFRKSSRDPVLVTGGGVAAELPPGVYEIEIVRGEDSRWVSAMRVRAGSWDLRKVEF